MPEVKTTKDLIFQIVEETELIAELQQTKALIERKVELTEQRIRGYQEELRNLLPDTKIYLATKGGQSVIAQKDDTGYVTVLTTTTIS